MRLAEIERCREIAIRLWNVSPEVEVDWSLRGLGAGECQFLKSGASRIRLNADIAAKVGHEEFLSTIAHEFAHAVDWAYAKLHGVQESGHGARWAAIIRSFGYPAQRCHSYDAVAVRHVEKFRYVCHCGPVQLVGPKIHRKIQAGAVYTCSKCRSRLVRAAVKSADELLKQLGNGD